MESAPSSNGANVSGFGRQLIAPLSSQFTTDKWDEQVFRKGGRLFPMKKTTQHLIAEVPRRQGRLEMTIGIDLGALTTVTCS
jgi:hypothetical protein